MAKPKRDDFNPNFIRALRLEKGWNQTKLAEELGVDIRTIQYWEAGEKSPEVKHREKMAELFDIPSFALLNDAAQIAYAKVALKILREDIPVPVLLDAVTRLQASTADRIEEEHKDHPLLGILGKKK